MSLASSTVYWYFPMDVTYDITTDLIELSLDKVTWTAATHDAPSTAQIADSVAASPVPSGYTRQWARILTGPAQPIALSYGGQKVHGRVTDSPEVPYFAWQVNVPTD